MLYLFSLKSSRVVKNLLISKSNVTPCDFFESSHALKIFWNFDQRNWFLKQSLHAIPLGVQGNSLTFWGKKSLGGSYVDFDPHIINCPIGSNPVVQAHLLLSNSNNLSLKIALLLPPLHLSGFGSCYSAKVNFFQIVLEKTCFAHTNRKFWNFPSFCP